MIACAGGAKVTEGGTECLEQGKRMHIFKCPRTEGALHTRMVEMRGDGGFVDS